MVKHPPKPADRISVPRHRKSSTQIIRSPYDDLSELIPDSEEMEGLYEEIKTASDRAAALVATSQLDQFIDISIILRMKNIDVETRKLLHKDSGSLSRLSAKIDLAYALGIYKDDYRKILHIIRDIRNIYAHSVRYQSFSDKEIQNKCDKINNGVICDRVLPEDYPALVGENVGYFYRFVFVNSCHSACAMLLNDSIEIIKIRAEEVEGIPWEDAT